MDGIDGHRPAVRTALTRASRSSQGPVLASGSRRHSASPAPGCGWSWSAAARSRAELARRLVTERSGSDRIDIALADFSRLAEVRRLADDILSTYDRLHLLVNNAGLMSPNYRLSPDSFELTIAVNHLAPFLLTNLLLDRLEASAQARIVTVASEAHRGTRLDLADLARQRTWSPMRAYGRSKLCNILFTRELAAQLAGESDRERLAHYLSTAKCSAGVVATCLHPGVVATAIGRRGGFR